MRKEEQGSLVLPLIIVGTLLAVVAVFAIWAFAGMQDYKTKSDQKSAAAVAAAVKAEDTKKDAANAEEAKQPLKSYTGPEQYGSLHYMYPKTWSGYVGLGVSGFPLDAYYYPDYIPNFGSVPMALRTQVINADYNTQLQGYQDKVKTGKVTISPYRLSKVPNVLGVRVVGQISEQQTGDMVLLPLRDKTIAIWTEGNQYENDFNTNILPNVTFIP